VCQLGISAGIALFTPERVIGNWNKLQIISIFMAAIYSICLMALQYVQYKSDHFV